MHALFPVFRGPPTFVTVFLTKSLQNLCMGAGRKLGCVGQTVHETVWGREAGHLTASWSLGV